MKWAIGINLVCIFLVSFLSVLNFNCSESWTIETADVHTDVDWGLSVAVVEGIDSKCFFERGIVKCVNAFM